jgi:hypothetical protein
VKRTPDLINGVPVDQYGSWCPHGKRIMVADPSDLSDYPVLVFAEPWPCDRGCTRAECERQLEEEAAEYEADRWREYWDMCAEGLSGAVLRHTDERYDGDVS